MTDQEKFEYCGRVAMAASDMGIYIGKYQESFVWFDPVCGAKWVCPNDPDPKERFLKACQSLTNYLTSWNQPKTT